VALSAARGTFLVATSDVVTTTFAESGFGFQPKALIIWTSNRADATESDGSATTGHGRTTIGFVASTSSRVAVFAQSRDANAQTDTDSQIRTDAICGFIGPTGSTDGLIDLQSFDADGFTAVVDVQHVSTGARYHWLALGGSDITDVATGTWTEPGSTGVSAVVTGLSFQPSFAMLSGTQGTAAGTIVTDHGLFVGAMTAADQWVSAYAENHSLADGDPWAYGRDGECAAMFDGAAAIDANVTNFRASYSSFNSDGFSINVAERTGSRLFGYLAIKGTGTFAKVTSVTTRTDGNDIVVTGAGVGAPRGMFAMSNLVAEHASDTPTNENGAGICVGAATSISDRACVMTRSQEAAATTNIISGSQYDTGAVTALMDVKSVDSDGVTFVMDDTEPTAGSWVGVILFGDVQSVPGRTTKNIRSNPLGINLGMSIGHAGAA
jgi:hypothetical protein